MRIKSKCKREKCLKLFAISNIIKTLNCNFNCPRRGDGLLNISRSSKNGIYHSGVAIYCKEGRIDGAVLKGRMWMIPSEATKPEDPRRIHRTEHQKYRVIMLTETLQMAMNIDTKRFMLRAT